MFATYEASTMDYDARLGAPIVSGFFVTLVLWTAVIACAIYGTVHFHPKRRVAYRAFGAAAVVALPMIFPLYSPAAPFSWLARLHGSDFGKQLGRDLLVVGFGCGAVLLAALRPTSRHETIHGTSRFARLLEVRRAGLLAARGIVLGKLHGQVVRAAGTEHVLALMPTRAGKTSGFLIPTVLGLDLDHFVVTDVKGAEVFQATAGAAARTHDVYRFEPTAPTDSERNDELPTTARWNPLDEVPRGPGDVAALQRQAADFIVPARRGQQSHWILTARQLYVALALHVIYDEDLSATLGTMRRWLLAATGGDAKGEADSLAPFRHMAEAEQDPEYKRGWRDPETGGATKQHPELIALAKRFLASESRELSGIISTLSTFLEPWGDPRVDAATRTSDFALDRFVPGSQEQRPGALYLVVPRHDVERLSPLLRLFYSSLATRISSDRRFVDWHARPAAQRRRTFLFQDEFPLLGYMPVFGEMISTLAGYGATLMIFAQDLAQLRSLYGANEPITGGCPILVATANQKPETLRYLSTLSGDTTVLWDRTSLSTGAGGGLFGKQTRSRSKGEARRPLLTAAEIRTLDRHQALLFAPGLHPVRVAKAPYFRDERLHALSLLPPPTAPFPGVDSTLKKTVGGAKPDAESKVQAAETGAKPSTTKQREWKLPKTPPPQCSQAELRQPGATS